MANKITHTAKKRSNALSGAMLLVAGVNLGSVWVFSCWVVCFWLQALKPRSGGVFFFKWTKIGWQNKGGNETKVGKKMIQTKSSQGLKEHGR